MGFFNEENNIHSCSVPGTIIITVVVVCAVVAAVEMHKDS